MKTLRFSVRGRLAAHRHLNAPVRAMNHRFSPDGQSYVTAMTDILIDGFQGSANTFATRCFRHAQLGRDVAIAHHAHAPEQVVYAVRLGLPVVVMLRDPHGAVRSTLRRWPDLKPGPVFDGYARYYRHLRDIAEHVVLAPFEVVTVDFGRVIAEVNAKFGTDFAPFVHTPESARVGYDPPPHRVGLIPGERAAAEQRIVELRSDRRIERAEVEYQRMRRFSGW